MPPKTVTITLDENELRVAIQLFDAAVKHLGLSVAESALVLFKKFDAQATEQLKEQAEPAGKKDRSKSK